MLCRDMLLLLLRSRFSHVRLQCWPHSLQPTRLPLPWDSPERTLEWLPCPHPRIFPPWHRTSSPALQANLYPLSHLGSWWGSHMMPMGINYLGPGESWHFQGVEPASPRPLWPVRVGSGRLPWLLTPAAGSPLGGVLLNMHTPRVCPSLQGQP